MDEEAGPSQPRNKETNLDFANLDLGGFCVYPLPWCPHIEGIKENWPQTIWYDLLLDPQMASACFGKYYRQDTL